MVDAVSDQVLVDSFNGFAQGASDCISAVGREDVATHDVVYGTAASFAANRALLVRRRDTVATRCVATFATSLRDAAVRLPDEFSALRDEFTVAIRDLAVQRALLDAQIDAGNCTEQRRFLLSNFRPIVDGCVYLAGSAVARVANLIQAKTSRFFVDLNLVSTARAKLRLASSSANAFALLVASGVESMPQEDAAMAGAIAAAALARNAAETATSPFTSQLMMTWNDAATTVAMFAALRQAAGLRGADGSAASELDPAVIANSTENHLPHFEPSKI
jgi:hypothetical protein